MSSATPGVCEQVAHLLQIPASRGLSAQIYDKLGRTMLWQGNYRSVAVRSVDGSAPAGPQEIRMKKTLASLLAVATIAVTLAASATDASAQWRWRGGGWGWRGGGWGWGAGVAAGAIGGAVIAGAIVASRPPGYVVYPAYAEPVYGPGCYWASQPVYDYAGRVVGYSGQPVQVCPGYVAPPPPGYAGAPPPGYAGVPPPGYAGAPPPGYAGAPPPDYGDAPPPGYGDAPPPANAAPRRKPPAKQQQVQPKEDGKPQVEPKDQE